MGRIAELFEKKANGSITEEEQKELIQLQKEAEALVAEETPEETPEEVSEEETAEKVAQNLADIIGKRMEASDKRVEALLEKIAGQKDIEEKKNNEGGVFYDRALGKKVSVSDLAEQKVALPSRKAAGKTVTEVTARTVKFIEALAQKNVEKLQILSEGTAADGGYLVPEEFANLIVEDVRDTNIMRQISRPGITVTSDTFHLPNLASRPKAAWRNEKAVKNTSTANFGENVFTPYSLAVIVGLSNELVADASIGVGATVVNYVAELMSTAIAEKEEQAFWVGSGSGQPSGVDGGVYSPRTVAAVSVSDADRADAIIAGFHRTPQGYRNKGVWVANSGTWENISQLKDSQGNYLLTRLSDGPTQTLKGRPVYESNYLAGGTLLYGDFSSAYQIVDREGISVRVSDEATVAGTSGFETNTTFIRVEKRVDAEVVLLGAITKVTGLGTP